MLKIRLRASRLAGKDAMPFRILDTDMETARIMMVDSNFQQRDELLPSEKAKACLMRKLKRELQYYMKMSGICVHPND